MAPTTLRAPADSPRRCYLFHWASFCVSFAGIMLVLVAHGHYTIDVIIAYYVTTTLFWAYHTMANNQVLKVDHLFTSFRPFKNLAAS
jgi:hypothetical protein